MATKSVSLRTLVSLLNDLGEDPATSFDEALLLSGFKVSSSLRVALAPSADDQAVAHDDCSFALVWSHNYPFSLRVDVGETLMGPMRVFMLGGDDEDAASLAAGDLLLTGNGDNEADVQLLFITTVA